MTYCTIWKIPLKLVDVQDIEVPADSELLTARDQHEQICVWFKCNPDNPPAKRQIAIIGTGHPAPEDGRYVGTGFLHGGELVFHVFERLPVSVGGSRDGR